MFRVLYHTFIGRRFAIKTQKGLRLTFAECDESKRELRIPVDGDRLCELEWIIHESLHACYPWMDEEYVKNGAKSMSALLWRLGWRKETEEKE